MWHGQCVLPGRVEMQLQRLKDQETYSSSSCILFNEPLRPSGQRIAAHGWRLNRNSLSMINVPFQSHLEAEIVRLAMDIENPPHQHAVQIEFRVQGRILAVSVLEWANMGVQVSVCGSIQLENETLVSQFLLEGLTDTEELKPLLFATFLLVYIVAVVGNLGIFCLIVIDSRLHTPMYFFLANLSLLDTAYISNTVPQVLVHLLAPVRTMSYRACLTQIFFLHFLAPWECFLLTAMSYDRYAAICQPLHYLVLMGQRTRTGLAVISCLLALANSLTHTILAALLKFCRPRLITHFFCDLPPLLKLSCSSTQANELALFFFSFLVALAPCTLVVISYIHVVAAVLRIRSAEGRRKAFSTCGAHITMVCIFYITSVLCYILPSSAYSGLRDRVLSVLYVVLTPMLNPIIYSMRNKDVKRALFKALGKESDS
ncbi:olfactory receptor 3A3 [Pteropus alecto]|uniref:olfactory receptor 3A3 n=1 Tax=Pteropus alecto TaxID=9402 RepID=UPI00076857E2|nr:olfactory receptor 3A3 [Pteropus alecto]